MSRRRRSLAAVIEPEHFVHIVVVQEIRRRDADLRWQWRPSMQRRLGARRDDPVYIVADVVACRGDGDPHPSRFDRIVRVPCRSRSTGGSPLGLAHPRRESGVGRGPAVRDDRGVGPGAAVQPAPVTARRCSRPPDSPKHVASPTSPPNSILCPILPRSATHEADRERSPPGFQRPCHAGDHRTDCPGIEHIQPGFTNPARPRQGLDHVLVPARQPRRRDRAGGRGRVGRPVRSPTGDDVVPLD